MSNIAALEGDEVEVRWEAPSGARIERVRVTAIEVRVVQDSEGTHRVPGRESDWLDVRGAEAEQGLRSLAFPVSAERKLQKRERVEFDLRVDADTMRGDTASDTYVLGGIGVR